MASIQVRHQRSCALAKVKDGKSVPTWTSVAALDEGRCTCVPTFTVVTPLGDGKLARETVGTDRAAAEKRAADVVVLTENEKYDAPPPALKFGAFADEWLAGMQRRSTTVSEYATTIAFAKKVIGRKPVARVDARDIKHVLTHVSDEARKRKRRDPETGKLVPRELSPATLHKHARQLSRCFNAAIKAGLITVNPVSRLDDAALPQQNEAEVEPFLDNELPRLWAALAERPAYLTACKLAAFTGLRHGEVAGLEWRDISFTDRTLTVRRQWTHGKLVERTKGGSRGQKWRIVHLVPEAVALLEGWYKQTADVDNPADPVVENEAGGRLDDSRTRKVLSRAMRDAGIPRIGEGGRARTFHSLRATFARIALENGAPLQWVADELGHSSIELTRRKYGRWSSSGKQAQADALAGAFAS